MSSPVPFDDVRSKLEAANLGYPIAWPNTVFRRPQPPGPWLSVECTSRTLVPIEISGGVWQEEGTAFIDVFVPAGSGTDTARSIAKAVANVFRGLGAEPVVYLGGSIGAGVTTESDGMWWTLPVTVDWRYQDTT